MPAVRPPLPQPINPFLTSEFGPKDLPPVKYQVLNCQGSEILVGRIKLETPTPTGHAFVLRRYDTGAISATTMFRAAFPLASEREEKEELMWIKENHDLSGRNGSSREPHLTRLAGTWIGPELALEIAPQYHLVELVKAIIAASPNPGGTYRRSGKATTTSTPKAEPSPSKPVSSAKPASLTESAPPSKRRKAADHIPKPSPSPARTPPPARSPPPRRSLRATKSPSAKPVTDTKLTCTPKRITRREQVVNTPGGSDQTVVDEDAFGLESAMGLDLLSQDLVEQKEMIQDLKAKREAALKAEVEDIDMDAPTKAAVKRTREISPLKFQPKPKETESRVIATNRRVSRFQEMEPKTKSVVWGMAAFALTAGAVTFLPSLF